MRRALLRQLTNLPADRAMVMRGRETAHQVSSAASEFVRTRRDPALIALRRRDAARRRVQAWGVGAGLGLAGTAAAIVSLVGGSVSATVIFFLIFAAVVLAWAGAGFVRAVGDLRRRGRVVAALPPPQPGRGVVHLSLRGEMDRLSGYSDSLRQLVGLVGVVDDSTMGALRREVIEEADAAELRLRRLAGEATALLKAGGRNGHGASRAQTLQTQIDAGVAEYGRLVGAVSDAVEASGTLRERLGQLEPVTERLTALTLGMRELAA